MAQSGRGRRAGARPRGSGFTRRGRRPCRSCSRTTSSGWSPNMLVSSLDELRGGSGGTGREPFERRSLDRRRSTSSATRAMVEYRVNAVFSGPFAVDDETCGSSRTAATPARGRHRGGVDGGQDLGVPELFRQRSAAGADARRLAGAQSQPCTGPFRLVLEDSPYPVELWGCSRSASPRPLSPPPALGDDEEFGIFVRDDDGRVVAGISGIVWRWCS